MRLPSALNFLILALIALGFLINDSINVRGDLADANRQLTEARQQLQAASRQLADLQARIDSLQATIVGLNDQVASLTAQLQAAQSERQARVEALQAAIANLQDQLAALTQQAQTLRDANTQLQLRIKELEVQNASQSPVELSLWPGLALFLPLLAGAAYLGRRLPWSAPRR